MNDPLLDVADFVCQKPKNKDAEELSWCHHTFDDTKSDSAISGVMHSVDAFEDLNGLNELSSVPSITVSPT